MQISIEKAMIAGVLLCASWAALGGQKAVPFEPFLDCAALKVSHALFLKESGPNTGDEMHKLERGAQFFLQIAESLSERHLRDEFMASAEQERDRAEKLFRAGGADAIVLRYKQRDNECSGLVQKHQQEIMKAADRLYAGQR